MNTPSSTRPILKPFMKWAGGKGQLLSEIRRNYPAALGTTILKYAEPFIGGGAVLFDILSHYDLEAVYISDVNFELINAYTAIKQDVSALIHLLCILQQEYDGLSEEEQSDYYYAKRDRFNLLKLQSSGEMQLELASLFLFLNHTCFNGLYRVNRRGLFNVPRGRYKNPRICDTENLLNISEALQNVTIVCADYRQSSSFIDSQTFAYFDPPYRPLNATSTFTAYSQNVFNNASQKQLAQYIDMLNARGATILLSNSDPKNVDEQDSFFEELYQNHHISRVLAARMINSKKTQRGKIQELLISNSL